MESFIAYVRHHPFDSIKGAYRLFIRLLRRHIAYGCRGSWYDETINAKEGKKKNEKIYTHKSEYIYIMYIYIRTV